MSRNINRCNGAMEGMRAAWSNCICGMMTTTEATAMAMVAGVGGGGGGGARVVVVVMAVDGDGVVGRRRSRRCDAACSGIYRGHIH